MLGITVDERMRKLPCWILQSCLLSRVFLCFVALTRSLLVFVVCGVGFCVGSGFLSCLVGFLVVVFVVRVVTSWGVVRLVFHPALNTGFCPL